MIWDVLAKKDHTYHLSEQEYIYYKNKWWLHFNKSGSDTPTIEKTFWFLASVVHLGTFRTRTWKRTICAYLLSQAQTMAVGTKFNMVEMARLLVVF